MNNFRQLNYATVSKKRLKKCLKIFPPNHYCYYNPVELCCDLDKIPYKQKFCTEVPIRILNHQKKPHQSELGKMYYRQFNFGHVRKKKREKKLSEYASIIYQMKGNFNTNKWFAYGKVWRSPRKELYDF